MENKTVYFVCDVTYSANRQITKVRAEYKHTGTIYELIKNGAVKKYTTDKSIADNWAAKRYKINVKEGYYFVSRLAIPTITASGLSDWWYINNPGDFYQIHRVSKYGKKIHSQLSMCEDKIC